MSHKFLLDTRFHELLIKIDEELAQKIKQSGCIDCKCPVHQANYPRSPQGIPARFRDYYKQRLSYCCTQCRKRFTPPSVRFFARRWFPAPFFLFISLLTLGINERRLSQVKQHLGVAVSESTWKRWRRWWSQSFIHSEFWRYAKGLVRFSIDIKIFSPRALLEVFNGMLVERFIWLLKFLSPITSTFASNLKEENNPQSMPLSLKK